MLNLLSTTIIWGTENFGYGKAPNGNPAVFVFGFPIYLYAIIIVSGMALAILIAGHFFKKRGYDPYDICTYALVVIPFGVLGARLYVFVFPWEGVVSDWSHFFDFRSGGLGIYGGVIFGYIAAYVTARIKKQDFRIIRDCIMPGLFIAQSIGRWGNFANQEAYGNLVANLNLQFFPYAVYIDGIGEWHQATFFYESMATLVGFIVCLLLVRSKKYKLGWLTSFYGIYYGIARLIIEGLRTDSLYLWIGHFQTDIRISQLVSIFAIVFGIWGLTQIYRKQLHALYRKMFSSERAEVDKSRYVLFALSILLIAFSVVMYLLGGETKLIAGVIADALAVYCILGIISLTQRLRLYCTKCGTRNEPEGGVISEKDAMLLKFVIFIVLAAMLLCFAVIVTVYGVMQNISNGIVLGVAAVLCAAALSVMAILNAKKLKGMGVALSEVKNAFKAENGVSRCQCGSETKPRLNKLLLLIFPYKKYLDYGVENLKEWVDPDKNKKVNADEK